jgi:hypothetical protein
VSEDELPEQIVDGLAVAETVGVGLTVTVTRPVLEQPVDVPVTVYVVVVTGETVTVVPLNEPGIHEYVVAPLPVNEDELPEQIVDGLAVAVTVGVGFTVTVTRPVLEQPVEVPVTV